MIRLNNINMCYKDKIVFNNLSATFDKKGIIYSIIGKSGSGKTTLFNIITGLEKKYTGEYYYNSIPVSQFNNSTWSDIRSSNMGIVFQDYKLLENLSVYENLIYASSLSQSETNARIDQLIQLFELENEIKQKVSSLSGGQKQRLAIARAIINNPQILLMDEPTANLDDDNIQNLIRYLNKIKESMIVIIVTHDNTLIDFSDKIYLLKNGQLIEHKSSVLGESVQFKASSINRKSPIIYFKSYFQAKLIDIIRINIPIIIIFAIFINIFGMINFEISKNSESYFAGLSDDTIYISVSQFNNEYIKQRDGYDISDDGKRLFFSKQDLEDVLKIPGVLKARLYNSINVNTYDSDHSFLEYSIAKENVCNQIKNSVGYSKCPSHIDFSFESINIPSEYFSSFNEKGITILNGSVPLENTNQILIPDILAYQLFGQLNAEESISLLSRSRDGKQINKTYVISGIYQTEFNDYISSSYVIYCPYSQTDFIDLFLTEETYNSMRNNDYEVNKHITNYRNPLYDTFESYKEAIGTSLPDMILKFDKKDTDVIHKELKLLFPHLNIYSQYELKNGEMSATYNNLLKKSVLMQAGSVLILGLIVTLLSNNYIKARSKEIAILYMLGYKKRYITSLLLFEYLVTTAINISVSYILVYLTGRIIYSGSANIMLIKYIFSGKLVFSMVISMIFIMLFSVILSLKQVDETNLKNYLNEIQ